MSMTHQKEPLQPHYSAKEFPQKQKSSKPKLVPLIKVTLMSDTYLSWLQQK